MACAWENKQRCIELCPVSSGYQHALGSYVYVTLGDPPILIEIPADFSDPIIHGPISFESPNLTKINAVGGSAQRHWYAIANEGGGEFQPGPLVRHIGGGVMADVEGAPPLLSPNVASTPLGGALRAVQEASPQKLYSSADGETWPLSGTVPSVDFGVGAHTSFAGLTIATFRDASIGGPFKPYYSSDAGVTWQLASGVGSNNWETLFHAGSLLLAGPGGGITHGYSSDGLNWAEATGLPAGYDLHYSYAATNGTGTVLMVQRRGIFNNTYARSTDNGVSWVTHTFPSSFSGPVYVFWDGTQFVLFATVSSTIEVWVSVDGVTSWQLASIELPFQYLTRIVDTVPA